MDLIDLFDSSHVHCIKLHGYKENCETCYSYYTHPPCIYLSRWSTPCPLSPIKYLSDFENLKSHIMIRELEKLITWVVTTINYVIKVIREEDFDCLHKLHSNTK